MTSELTEVTYPGPRGYECPYPVFEYLRREAPVYQIPDRPNIFIVSRYEDVREVYGNATVFSSHRVRSSLNGFEALLGDVGVDAVPMVDVDPPHLKPKRDLAFVALKPARLARFEPLIMELTDRLIDGFIDERHVEFCGSFAQLLPAHLTMRMMGVPDSDEELVRSWAKLETSGLTWLPEEDQARQRTRSQGMAEYLSETIVERRAAPRENDLISEIIQTQVDRDGEFNLPEVLGQVGTLLGGGVITTAHFLSTLMYQLIVHPEQMAKVRADFRRIPRMIEEGLRLEGPSLWNLRRVAVDTELSGVKLPAGAYVIAAQGSANRDERKFPCPDEFDIDRENVERHLAFGHGPHTCLGMPLARMELRVAFERLLSRLENLRLVEDQDLRHIVNMSYRGFVALHLEFDPVRADGAPIT